MRLLDAAVLLLFSSFLAIPLFWIPIHAGIRFLRRLKGKTYVWALVVWPLTWWAFLGYYDFWFQRRFDRNAWTALLGAALLAAEVVLTRKASGLLGFARLVGRSELDPEGFGAGLLQQGVYNHIRHPRYVGAMAAQFGLAVLGGSWLLLAAAAASVPLYYLMTLLEERELATRFGAEYLEYQRRVPRFLPRPRR